MTPNTCLIRLQAIADTIIVSYESILRHKIPPVKVCWAKLYMTVAGDYHPASKTIRLNDSIFDKWGFDRMNKLMRHEVSHHIVYSVYPKELEDHGANFKKINTAIGGIISDNI